MATFIDDIFGKLFPKKNQPLHVKENFSQTEMEEEHVENWIKSEEGKSFLNLIKKNYHFKTSGMNSHPEIHILNSKYANGFAISYESPFTQETFSKLFFAFGLRMLDLGYHRVSLDRKIEELSENVRSIEKQYFKPPLSNVDFSEKIDQLYGNVSIEKVSIDGKPSFLKILASVYSDHLYKDAAPFDEFIEKLFKN